MSDNSTKAKVIEIKNNLPSDLYTTVVVFLIIGLILFNFDNAPYQLSTTTLRDIYLLIFSALIGLFGLTITILVFHYTSLNPNLLTILKDSQLPEAQENFELVLIFSRFTYTFSFVSLVIFSVLMSFVFFNLVLDGINHMVILLSGLSCCTGMILIRNFTYYNTNITDYWELHRDARYKKNIYYLLLTSLICHCLILLSTLFFKPFTVLNFSPSHWLLSLLLFFDLFIVILIFYFLIQNISFVFTIALDLTRYKSKLKILENKMKNNNQEFSSKSQWRVLFSPDYRGYNLDLPALDKEINTFSDVNEPKIQPNLKDKNYGILFVLILFIVLWHIKKNS